MDGALAARVEDGNQLLRHMCRWCRLAAKKGVWWVIENPTSSRLWRMPEIQDLISRTNAYFIVLDFCQYGTPWRKRAKLLTNCPHLAILSRM